MLFSDDDLDKIEPDSTRARWKSSNSVKLDEIDPLYYDASYYLTPEDEGKTSLFAFAEGHGRFKLRGHRQSDYAHATTSW